MAFLFGLIRVLNYESFDFGQNQRLNEADAFHSNNSYAVKNGTDQVLGAMETRMLLFSESTKKSIRKITIKFSGHSNYDSTVFMIKKFVKTNSGAYKFHTSAYNFKTGT